MEEGRSGKKRGAGETWTADNGLAIAKYVPLSSRLVHATGNLAVGSVVRPLHAAVATDPDVALLGDSVDELRGERRGRKRNGDRGSKAERENG